MFDFPILSSSPVREVLRGLPFFLFFGPLDATGAIQGLKTKQKPTFFLHFKNRSETLWSDFGPPKGPPRGPLLDWVHGPEGPSGGPKFLIAPPGRPGGVQGGVNRASGITKCPSVQVKVFEQKKRFPWEPQTLFFRNCIISLDV